jgi:hypothetical protein
MVRRATSEKIAMGRGSVLGRLHPSSFQVFEKVLERVNRRFPGGHYLRAEGGVDVQGAKEAKGLSPLVERGVHGHSHAALQEDDVLDAACRRRTWTTGAAGGGNPRR